MPQTFDSEEIQETSDMSAAVQNRRRRRFPTPKEVTADSEAVRVPQLWMDTVLEQLEAPLGPAVTLSKLLSANEELLKKYATPKLVMKFTEMIQVLGPQRRFVDFFAAICIVQGRAVKPNQEMVLQLTWMDIKVRKSIYLQLRPLTSRGVSVPRGSSASSSAAKVLAKYGPVKLPSGALTDGIIDSSSPRPADFLGKEIYNRPKGFSPIGVTWAGAAAWERGHPEALFWDLERLGLKATKLRAEDGMGEKGEEVSSNGFHNRRTDITPVEATYFSVFVSTVTVQLALSCSYLTFT